MIKLKTSILLLSSALLAITGCASRVANLSAPSALPELEMNPQQGGLVFYRENTDTNPVAINISINGEYLSSLLTGESSQTAVCAQPTRITSAYTGADYDTAYAMKLAEQGNIANIQQGQKLYIKVIGNENAQPSLQVVDAEQAKQALQHIKPQARTLARVEKQQHCQAQASTQYKLDATTLFSYKGSTVNNILENGVAQLSALAQHIAKNYAQHNILVTGHTDPVGSAPYNQQLSLARAQSVRQVLIQNGLKAEHIKAEGKGESALLISNCAAKHPSGSPAEKQCNQPNRRVEINLYQAQ